MSAANWQCYFFVIFRFFKLKIRINNWINGCFCWILTSYNNYYMSVESSVIKILMSAI